MMLITTLSAEYRRNPLGIDATSPRLAWNALHHSDFILARETMALLSGMTKLAWLSGGAGYAV